MSGLEQSSIDDLAAAAHGIVRESHNVLQDAKASRDLDPFTHRFITELENCIESFDRFYPSLAAKLTKAASALGDVPFERHGFAATSGHNLARQIGNAVFRIAVDARNNREVKKVWKQSYESLGTMQFDPSWLTARIAAERDLLIDEFYQLHPHERLRRMLMELKAALANNSASNPFNHCFDLVLKIARSTESYFESHDVFTSGWSNAPSRKWAHPFKVTISEFDDDKTFISVEIYTPDGDLICGHSGSAPLTFAGDGTDLDDDPLGFGALLLHGAKIACDRWVAALTSSAGEPVPADLADSRRPTLAQSIATESAAAQIVQRVPSPPSRPADSNHPPKNEFDADSLPAEYREGGKPNGVPLVVPYLTDSADWLLTAGALAGARRQKKVPSVKVCIDGKLKDAHDFRALAAYRLEKTRRDDCAE